MTLPRVALVVALLLLSTPPGGTLGTDHGPPPWMDALPGPDEEHVAGNAGSHSGLVDQDVRPPLSDDSGRRRDTAGASLGKISEDVQLLGKITQDIQFLGDMSGNDLVRRKIKDVADENLLQPTVIERNQNWKNVRPKMNRTKRQINILVPRPRVNVPRVRVPSVRVPRVRVPSVRVPRVRVPRVRVPRVRVPKVRVPKVRVPRVRVPKVKVPRVRVFQVRVPRVRIPKVRIPKVRVPKVRIPRVRVPRFRNFLMFKK